MCAGRMSKIKGSLHRRSGVIISNWSASLEHGPEKWTTFSPKACSSLLILSVRGKAGYKFCLGMALTSYWKHRSYLVLLEMGCRIELTSHDKVVGLAWRASGDAGEGNWRQVPSRMWVSKGGPLRCLFGCREFPDAQKERSAAAHVESREHGLQAGLVRPM